MTTKKLGRPRTRREFYKIQWADGYGWNVVRPTGSGLPTENYRTKAAAADRGVDLSKDRWKHGYPTELVIKGRDGKIKERRTYGDDPKGRG